MTTRSVPTVPQEHGSPNRPTPVQHANDLATVELIRNLENRRFEAIIKSDFDAFAELCHEQLVYTHSDGARDSLSSYRSKVESGVYEYHDISHPVDDIIVVGNVALVIGRMVADLSVKGTPTRLDNNSLAVWVRADQEWKFLAYQPTPNRNT